MTVNIRGYDVLIDDEDYSLVSKYTWRPSKPNKPYFITTLKMENGIQKTMNFHRLIMGCTCGDDTVVDHINHDTLDNRKCNLRITTKQGNARNRSRTIRSTTGYKGVSFYKGTYHSSLEYENRHIFMGSSNNSVECARWYDMMAIKLFGEYACTNFDRELYKQEDIDKLYNFVFYERSNTTASGYIGVFYNKSYKKWRAQIYNKHIKKTVYLGHYDTPEEAARAHDKVSYELRGMNRKLNFPEEYNE